MSKRGTFSIVRRLTALTVVVGALALIVNGILISLAVRPMFDDLNESLAGRVAAVRTALQGTPLAGRAQQAQALSSMGLRVHRAPAGPASSDQGGASAAQDSYLEPLRGLLGAGVELNLVRRDTNDMKP